MKKKRFMALVVAASCLMPSFTGAAPGISTLAAQTSSSQTVETAVKDNGNGTFEVTYDNTAGDKIVVLVSKDGTDYKYYLSEGVVTEVIPMTLGNGTYKIRICKNIAGTKYSVKYTTSIDLELDDDKEVFTNPNIIVDYEVKEKAIKKAATLCKGLKTDTKKITKIYNYLVKYYTYDYAKVDVVRETVGYIPNVEQTFTEQMGICYDISSLFAAMLRSQGITAKVVTGYTPKISTLHAWNEVYDSKTKKWYIIDVTSDIAYYQAKVKYTMKKKAEDYESVKYYH